MSFSLDSFDKRWIEHPETDVDLCIMPIAPLQEEAFKSGNRMFYVPLYKELITQPHELAELTAIEDIIMIGYPNGIWDSVNNMPIVRKGITATHPKLNYDRKHEFMVTVQGVIASLDRCCCLLYTSACRRIHDSDAQEKRRSGMLHLVISRSPSLS